MKVALIGATGFVGAALLAEALERRHAVTAVVRDPGKLPKRSGLVAAGVDVNDIAALAAVLAGHDAVISAYNPGWIPGTARPALYNEQIRGTAAILAAVKQAGVRRVLWVGGAGGLEVAPDVLLMDTPGFPDWIKPGGRATLEALRALQREPGLQWTYLAPSALLQAGRRTGQFRLGGDRLLTDASGESRISVQDYAVAMIDELERPAHTGQRFTVGY